MPWSPKRYCITSGCGELVTRGRCSKHAREHARAVQEKRDREETWRDYDSTEWRRARELVLSREPNCRSCGRRASHVDHIVRLRDGGTHSLENLQPLCASCHGLKTYNETIRAAFERQKRRDSRG